MNVRIVNDVNDLEAKLLMKNKELIRTSPLEKYYQEFDSEHRIYRKVGQGS